MLETRSRLAKVKGVARTPRQRPTNLLTSFMHPITNAIGEDFMRTMRTSRILFGCLPVLFSLCAAHAFGTEDKSLRDLDLVKTLNLKGTLYHVQGVDLGRTTHLGNIRRHGTACGTSQHVFPSNGRIGEGCHGGREGKIPSRRHIDGC